MAYDPYYCPDVIDVLVSDEYLNSLTLSHVVISWVSDAPFPRLSGTYRLLYCEDEYGDNRIWFLVDVSKRLKIVDRY